MIKNLLLITVFLPLIMSIISGVFRNQIGRQGAHSITILGLAVSLGLSIYIASMILFFQAPELNFNLYTWGSGGDLFPFAFHVGFLLDGLTSIMLVVVTFVSFCVHVYSMGYMADDDGYQRFFSYISLFTFAMLMLVSANNFLQLFFGWEGVGLVSYLLIGFWFKKESAIEGNLKAFIVNRVGDFGFILGIALIFAMLGTLDYVEVFQKTDQLTTGVITAICLLLFVGAMGKSAQMPLHVWLPESMEGPTPISALIHAATMVTAGVFMIARMSPLFEHSQTALSVVLVIGATGALFTGLIAIVMTDIKRVIAYSTLSQLGYMMVAMGLSAYSLGIFHLATHAAFKAVLFLGAGSVIIAMHHEQDMRKMGGLWKHMPITYMTFLIGGLALCAIPPFAGFYSKDLIIDAAGLSTVPGATYAYYCVLIGAFVTALYTFRAFFMTFHGKSRVDAKTKAHLKESPWSVWVPLVLLAIPSVILGFIMVGPMLFDPQRLLPHLPQPSVMTHLGAHYHGAVAMMGHAIFTPTFWLVMLGISVAWVGYIWRPALPETISKKLSLVYNILINKYGFDAFNQLVFVKGANKIGQGFYKIGDQIIIDGVLVNGTGMTVYFAAMRAHLIQSGYLYHYATAMLLGLTGLILYLII